MNIDQLITRSGIALVGLWLGLFVVLGLLIVLVISFATKGETDFVHLSFTLNNYAQLFDPIYLTIFLRSMIIAGGCTFLCLLLGYPFAFALSRTQQNIQPILLVLLIIPFWTSSLIRSYAIMALLKTHGFINQGLLWLGLIEQPIPLLFSNTAVMIGLVYNLLPFMIFPIYTNLIRMDLRLLEAAKDLGANRWQMFKSIILPLSVPGIITGIALVYLPAMTLFYIPDLLGGAKSMLLGNLIQFQFLTTFDWPAGSATSIFLTMLLGLLIVIYRRTTAKQGWSML